MPVGAQCGADGEIAEQRRVAGTNVGEPVVSRAEASADVESAIDYYLAEDATDAALGFIDATQRVYARAKEISSVPLVDEDAKKILFGQDALTVR